MKFFLLLLVMQITMIPLVVPSTFLTSKYCPSQCGYVSISYPFGVGSECSKPGFDLTCNYSTNPPLLFIANQTNFQVTNILDDAVFITSGITTMPSDVKNYTENIWTLPKDGPYYLRSYDDMYITVIGCGVFANLIHQNVSIGQCATFCDSEGSLKNANGSSCANNIGCCQIPIQGRLTSDYMLELSRENKLYNVKAFLTSLYDYTFSADDVYYDYNYNTSTRVGVKLSWSIPYPHTCEAAQKSKNYACLAQESYCTNSDSDSGYLCSCPSYYYGDAVPYNPYIPGGCKDREIDIIRPNLHCQVKCGDMDIPFPFGLTPGCYRNINFQLFCINTTKTLSMRIDILSIDEPGHLYRVDEILIEEGQLRVDSTEEDVDLGRRYDTFSGSFLLHKDSTLLEWVIDYMNCDQAEKDKNSYACVSQHSSCVTAKFSVNKVGYYCNCTKGYQGNPYLIDGCRDIDECQHPGQYICNGICYNSDGTYTCCPHGTVLDARNQSCISYVPPNLRNLSVGFYIGLGFGIGLICLLIMIGLFFLRRVLRKRIDNKLRQKCFRQNHGLLLQQLIACNGEIAEKTKIFTLTELEKATSNFDQSRVIGRGGHGTVFKGLLSDQRVVAIKKSKLTIKREIDQFINEVVILSGISHRNIVKLFGCCLETEVPLLVYEFISNGTLHNHLHSTDLKSTLSWGDRLRIASETAGALSYLHSAASISIFHRDVKSANILLDEYLTSKVSDFGASRSIPVDQIHVTTAVQGTYGYLDPEYHYTGQLTEKSDVYSFGVILVELLTGKLPISSSRVDEERNLSIHFLRASKDNRVLELVEDRLKEEATTDELTEFINLAGICLRLRGADRPTMKQVEFKLQSMSMKIKQKNEIKQPNERSSSSCASWSTKEAFIFPCEELVITTSENQSISLLSCPR